MTPPASAAAPAIHRGRSAAPARPRVAPRGPRRASGPARRAPRPIQPPAQAERGLALGLLETLTGISRHQALDRLIRGRAWIALIAFALIGIVTLQLLLLTLNAHIGRALVRAAQLQRENAAYSIEDSELAGGERIESQAARLGMTLVPEGTLRFLRIDPRADIAHAGAALSAPVPEPSSEATAGSSGATETAPAPVPVPAPAVGAASAPGVAGGTQSNGAG